MFKKDGNPKTVKAYKGLPVLEAQHPIWHLGYKKKPNLMILSSFCTRCLQKSSEFDKVVFMPDDYGHAGVFLTNSEDKN
jgi:hypothetical protein